MNNRVPSSGEQDGNLPDSGRGRADLQHGDAVPQQRLLERPRQVLVRGVQESLQQHPLRRSDRPLRLFTRSPSRTSVDTRNELSTASILRVCQYKLLFRTSEVEYLLSR